MQEIVHDTAFSQQTPMTKPTRILFQNVRLTLVLLTTVFIAGCLSAPKYKGPESDHFDGSEFFNTLSTKKTRAERKKVAKEYFETRTQWPENVPVKLRDSLSFAENEFSVTFIGHATFLIRVDGLNILTDPIFSTMASPVEWHGPDRKREPAIALENLPDIDVILISHNHYDHLDKDSIKKIVAKQGDRPPVILAPLGNNRLFKKWGVSTGRDLDWGDSFTVQDTTIVLLEVRHQSGRGLTDQMKTLWGGYVINSTRGRIYFAGDTSYGPHFRETFLDSGPMRISLLPIGSYEPRWFMESIHVNPEEAVRAHKDLGSELSIGMHFGTFQLSTEGIDEPLDKLAEARTKYNIPDDEFITLEFGETLILE